MGGFDTWLSPEGPNSQPNGYFFMTRRGNPHGIYMRPAPYSMPDPERVITATLDQDREVRILFDRGQSLSESQAARVGTTARRER